jgi:hypothetical protein
MNAISLLYQTVYVLAKICFFRATPTSLPFSWFVVALLVIIDCLLNVYALMDLRVKIPADLSLAECYLGAIISVMTLLGVSYALLSQRKILSRLNKFLIAFFGTDLFIAACVQLLSFGQEKFALVQVALIIWRLAVQIRVVQFTFEVKTMQAILLLFAILFAASMPLWFIVGIHVQPQP